METIRLIESFDAWEENFDAEFLGLNPAEIEVLRELDDASLQTLHVAPVRPSVLTMQSKSSLQQNWEIRINLLRISLNNFAHFYNHDIDLKSLEIVLSLAVGRAGQIHPERVFLSKVTGFLAFRSLLWKGVTVKLAVGERVQRK